ncbi:MAG: hypothetical protein JXA22_09100 [Candidatus Thermoplasmatota archaeon]|nr:hypothetical protein [Candidatus Thermoplasmatota archaeon]
MDDVIETKTIFTCPHCSGKFKVVMMGKPKAYKCPTCKGTVTVFTDRTVQPGDLTVSKEVHGPRLAHQTPESTSKLPFSEMPVDDTSQQNEEERRLFSEIMEQVKEIRAKQVMAGMEGTREDVQSLKEEIVQLRNRISTLQEELRKARFQSSKDVASAPNENLENLISQLKTRILSQADIISNLQKEKEKLELDWAEMASTRNKDEEISQMEDLRTMLEQREVEINERELVLDTREAALNEQEKNNEKDREAGGEFKRELDMYQVKLEERAVALSNEKEDLERIKLEYAHVHDLAEDLKTKERELDEREESLHDMEKDLMVAHGNQKQTEMMLGAIKEKEKVLTIREKGLDEREEALVRSNHDLNELKRSLAAKQVEMDLREKGLRPVEGDLQKREEELRSASLKWKNFARQLKDYKEELARASEELGSREKDLLEREDKVSFAWERLKTLKDMMAQRMKADGDKDMGGPSLKEGRKRGGDQAAGQVGSGEPV